MKIKHVDHIGINVVDLEATKIFFVGLGFSVMGEAKMEGKLLDEVTGLKDARTELVMLKAPDGQLCIEVVKYHQPVDQDSAQAPAVNRLGLSHISFQVENLDDIVKNLRQKGHKLVGSVQNYKNVWKLCYVRGPEGIIIELAEQIKN
jgi:catechol 2,3-dioxygenase-like lactoylglutathione lyase family enzyme